jgi:hypothetical protein
MAVAFSKVVSTSGAVALRCSHVRIELGRFQKQMHGCDRDGDHRQFTDRDICPCEVKQKIIEKIDLGRGRENVEIHDNSLNLIKTRYKYSSSSTSSSCSMVLDKTGKQDDIHNDIRDITANLTGFSGQMDGKLWLMRPTWGMPSC